MAAGNASHHTAVMKVYNAAIVPCFMIFQEQACEISTPFLIGFIRRKILLGHEQIDTTLRYAMVNQNNVKLSHRKFIS